MKKTNAALNIKELEAVINHTVKNNRYLQAKGLPPIAIEVLGESGIGKTSGILQFAESNKLNFVKLNLAQIEELGDLVGYPIRQFEMCSTDDCVWVDEHAVEDYRKMEWKFTGKNRMSYCPPEWIAGRENEGGFLVLDDFNRADPRFMQATMELIDRQQYISWKLPQDWHIVLTCNPDDGNYNVTSMDDAQKTRYISMNLKFDIKCWAEWAEKNEIDGRCINFLLMHPELVKGKVNARAITTFFNSISSLSSFENNLPLIELFGEGSVGEEFANMFTLFINNKLDKLITPQEMLFDKKEEEVVNKLKHLIGSMNNYRADIASTLATRLVNFAVNYAETNTIDKTLIDRIGKLITENIFTNDLKFNIVRSLYDGNKTKFRLLTMNSELVKYVLA